MFILMLALALGMEPATATATPSSNVAMPPLTEASCNDPEKRRLLLDRDPAELSPIKSLQQFSDANKTGTLELLRRLVERAKWSSQQQDEFAKQLDVPKLAGSMDSAIELMSSMTDLIMIDGTEESRCHGFVDAWEMVPAFKQGAQQEWDARRKAIESEAARLGVTLD
jgi:hypothetical protein